MIVDVNELKNERELRPSQAQQGVIVGTHLHRLTTSENDFFEKKMHLYRVKMLRQDQLHEEDIRHQKTKNPHRVKSEFLAGSGDMEQQKVQKNLSVPLLQKHNKESATSTSSQTTLKTFIRGSVKSRQRPSAIPKYIGLKKSKDDTPPKVIEVDDETYVARLAAKGVLIPVFPSDSDIRKRKNILMQHSLFASDQRQKILEMYEKANQEKSMKHSKHDLQSLD